MIEKEYGKFFGVCDCCSEEVTPVFNTWGEVLDYMRNNKWRTSKNKTTGEWENFCPVCRTFEG